MEDMINRLMELFSVYQTLLLPIGILLSLGLCFLGYRWVRGWIAAFGFLIGFGGGYLVSSDLIDGNSMAPLMVGVLAGVVLLLLSFLIFKAGVFVLVAVLVGNTIASLNVMDRLESISLPGTIGDWIVSILPGLLTLVIAAAAGFAAVKATRIVIIIVTGAAGAYRAVMYAALFLGQEVAADTRTLWLGIIVLLAALGIVVQLFSTNKE